MENYKNHYLIISGQIANGKKKEFEQTFRLASTALWEGCIECWLSEEVSKEGSYHFYSRWKNEQRMKVFIESEDFLLVNGAFHALGSIRQVLRGEVSEVGQVII